jgi:uncharacterized protein (UPF0548 family)
MFLVSQPRRDAIDQFIAAQRIQNFSYPEVGRSREAAPTGYNLDHNRIKLGEGTESFQRAKQATRQWKMFDFPWLQLCWPDSPTEVGTTVAVLVSHFGFWSLNACRIVYVIDEPERFGFAYGTLRGHAEIGEERFSVELVPRDGSVWYDVYAFSRPGALARLAYPLSRSLQRRFAADSKAAMLRAVQIPEFRARNSP